MKYITLSIPDDADQAPAGWKQKIIHELVAYGVNFIYLAIFFGAFTWYRRLVLAEYHIVYLHYWIAAVQALILAKVVMIGEIFHLGGRLDQRPLILSSLYKTAVFTVLVVLFALLEASVTGLVHGKGPAGGLKELLSHGWDELLARCLVIFFAFIPLFAFQELARVLGKRNIGALFFRRRAPAGSAPGVEPDVTRARIIGAAASPPRPTSQGDAPFGGREGGRVAGS